MKLLLTFAGVTIPSIREVLVDLLGKPIAEATALCIPTSVHPMGGPASAWRSITGRRRYIVWVCIGVDERADHAVDGQPGTPPMGSSAISQPG